MAHRKWGLLCPEGHGNLVERDEWTAKGVAWCPHSEHGGNGRFYRMQEVKEGWYDPDHITPIDRSQADFLAEREAARTAAWEENRRKHMATDKPKAAKAAAPAKEPKSCLCGCGGQTKGGKFLPGHDARYHARVKMALAAGKTHEEAEALAAKGPLPASIVAAATADAPEPIKTAKPKAVKTKPVDLTSRASDEPGPTPDAGEAVDGEMAAEETPDIAI